MSFRQFAFGLTASFGIAWLAIVIVPFFMMRHLKPVAFDEAADGKEGTYHPKKTGRVINGAEIYAANGCYHCHSQLIRPTYAGNDLGRPDWAGLKADEERGDTRRETNIFDYQGEKFAQIGLSRLGPDLSNVGRRVEKIYAKDGDAKEWLLGHLYDPRANPERPTSKCPSFRFLFDVKEVEGQVPDDAIALKDGKAVVPGHEALALVDYLLAMKRDDAVPASMSHLPPAQKGAPEKAAPAAAAPAAPKG
jgi:cytochrome c oxidase cbb3-type subunit 2